MLYFFGEKLKALINIKYETKNIVSHYFFSKIVLEVLANIIRQLKDTKGI